jgi:chromosome segregation ATPase
MSEPSKENGDAPDGQNEKGDDDGGAPPALPEGVKLKLKKLERLETKYSELLRSYRIAFTRISSIDAFEATLREHTPLTSVNDPGAFVEFLQQNNLKSDIVMDELKRAVMERDDLKKRLSEAESKLSDSTATEEVPKEREDGSEAHDKEESDSEDFFSYESELPRLQQEAKEREEKVQMLEEQNKTLTAELESSKESAQQLSRRLEASAKDLAALREENDRLNEDQEQEERAKGLEARSKELEAKLASAQQDHDDRKASVATLQDKIALLERQVAASQASDQKQTNDLEQKIERLQQDLSESQEAISQHEKRNATLNGLVQTLRGQLSQVVTLKPATDAPAEAPETPSNDTATPKKKNKKKKKGSKATEAEAADSSQAADEPTPQASTSDLRQQEIDSLHNLCELKDAEILKLQGKLKDQEGLTEEIESLRDDLVNVGSEHVTAKEQIKALQAEKLALQNAIDKLEKEAGELRSSHELHADASESHQKLSAEFNELKTKADALETDRDAAQRLAASRFKEMAELKDIMQRAQPELQSLRSEVGDLRRVKEELASKGTDLKKLEGREKDLRNEIARYKKQLGDRDVDVRSLNDKVNQAHAARREAEDATRKTQRELQSVQSERKDAVEARERIGKELAKTQDDLQSSRATVQRLEQSVARLNSEAQGLKEEIALKTAQHASAQSLMNSMHDQAQELGAQMKEMRARCESLEEELADAHRLLSERSREADTMRRLLAEVDGRADARIKEMREQMDLAIEERDRAEELASNVGRKKSRELDELKTKVREAEAALRGALQEKEEIERTEGMLRRQRDDYEAQGSKATDELKEMREAMGQLRDALDDAEKQIRELEKERATLKQSLEESQSRIERLQKSTKAASDEIKTLQHGQSSRTSLDTAASPSRLSSPPPRTGISPTQQGQAAKVDYVYLKNVLLQFMEQKDKKHQMSLVPVLGMLLHFDK